jgi:hypothetical protein
MSLQYNGKYNGKDQWVSVVECHHCKKITPTKETTIISIDYNYSQTVGKTFVNVCKECHRDTQLNKLLRL